MKSWLPSPWIALTALLIAPAAPQNGYAFTIWIALIPWIWFLLKEHSVKQLLIQGFWLSFIFSVCVFYWIAPTLAHYGQLPAVLAGLLFVLFGLVAEPQFVLLTLLGPNVLKSKLPRALQIALFASLYVAAEGFIPKVFKDTLGHAFTHSDWLRQNADLFGAHGLSWIVIWVNFTLFFVVRAVRTRTVPSIWLPIGETRALWTTAIALVSLATLYGAWRSHDVAQWMSKPSEEIPMAIIQGNVGDFEKLMAESGYRGAARELMERMQKLTDHALTKTPRPEVVFWPETTYPSNFRSPETPEDQMRDDELERFVSSRKITLIFGGYDHFMNKDHNAFFMLEQDQTLQVYRKHILLLLGEYIPLADSFPSIKQMFPMVGNFGRGPGPTLFTLKTPSSKQLLKFGPLICYEALYPDHVIGAARMGSQAILNATNDSWFGPTAAPELHLSLSRFRSIESRLPQVRSTNTGVSAVVLPDGALAVRSGLFEPVALNFNLALYPPKWTLIKALGDWFKTFCFCLAVVLSALSVRNRFTQVSKT